MTGELRMKRMDNQSLKNVNVPQELLLKQSSSSPENDFFSLLIWFNMQTARRPISLIDFPS